MQPESEATGPISTPFKRRHPVNRNLSVVLALAYGTDLDGRHADDELDSAAGFSFSGRSNSSNLTEKDAAARAKGAVAARRSAVTMIPRTLRLDFDFYRVLFLHMRNDSFSVSTMRTLLSFERLSRVLGTNMPQSSVKAIVALQDNTQMITWDRYSDYIDVYEKSRLVNRIYPGDEESDFTLEKETAVGLSMPERIFLTMEDSGSSYIATVLAWVRVGFILSATIGIILDSEPSLATIPEGCIPAPCPGPPESPGYLATIEFVVIVAFTVDYVVKLCLVGFVRMELMDRSRLIGLCTGRESLKIHKEFLPRVGAFLISFFSIIDLVSIVPYYVRIALGNSSAGLQVFRVIRLINIMRLLKLKQFKDIKVILVKAFGDSVGALGLLFLVFLIVAIFFGTIIYFIESGSWYPAGEIVPGGDLSIGAYYRPTSIDPSVYELTPFKSVLYGVWYAIVSGTTTGFGDMVPSSTLGKFVAGIYLIVGVVIIALPIGVVGSNFTREYQRYFAIRQQLSIHGDRRIQKGILKGFMEGLEELEHEEQVILNEPLQIAEHHINTLHEMLDTCEETADLFNRIEIATAAESLEDVKEFLSWALNDLDRIKDKIPYDHYKKAHQVALEISFELIQKISNQ